MRIVDMCQDDVISDVINDFTVDTTNVSDLDLSDHRLRSFQHLSLYSSLSLLVLDRNQLRDHALQSLPRLPSLHTLCLNQNLLSDLVRVLGVLGEATPSLVYLSLLDNPLCGYTLPKREEAESVCEMIGRSSHAHHCDHRTEEDERHERYRVQVLGMLPTLRYLDYRAFTCDEISKANDKAEWSR